MNKLFLYTLWADKMNGNFLRFFKSLFTSPVPLLRFNMWGGGGRGGTPPGLGVQGSVDSLKIPILHRATL